MPGGWGGLSVLHAGGDMLRLDRPTGSPIRRRWRERIGAPGNRTGDERRQDDSGCPECKPVLTSRPRPRDQDGHGAMQGSVRTPSVRKVITTVVGGHAPVSVVFTTYLPGSRGSVA